MLEVIFDIQGFLQYGPVRGAVTAGYLFVLFLICVYGAHRYWLVVLLRRHGGAEPLREQASTTRPLPRVTVQLPMYNEPAVAERVIDAAAGLDYPAELLQIQVVDDSTDVCRQIVATRVAYWVGRGVNMTLEQRQKRTGFKAGALAAATGSATGEFLAIFDADFVPPATFLRQCLGPFEDPKVGMVQARWGHLNRDDSALTRTQAIFLDGHFLIEHAARASAGLWLNFNGTAGVWRKAAILDAGGWQHDTLTEDLDLSYRAQLRGWRFVFLPHVVCPAELPPQIDAFKSQQHRWTKGSIQTALKLLPTVMRSSAPWRVKLEAVFHLTCPMVYLYITLMVLLFYPVLALNAHAFEPGSSLAALGVVALFAFGSIAAGTFYVASQRAQGLSTWRTLFHLPMLMAIGVGIAVNNSRACLEAILGIRSDFVRTPKFSGSLLVESVGGIRMGGTRGGTIERRS